MTNREGCRFLLEKYSRKAYPLISRAHFNTPATLGEMRLAMGGSGGASGVQQLPPHRNLRGAGITAIERWMSEAAPRDLVYAGEQMTRLHLLQAGRLLRLADLQVCDALLTLPLEAIRAFLVRVKPSGWRRLTGTDTGPVLTLRLARVEPPAQRDGSGGAATTLGLALSLIHI